MIPAVFHRPSTLQLPSPILALLLLLASWPASAQQGRMVQGQITSPALATNLFGDSATRTYRVYLPPSYDTGTKQYPVVYALHGWYNDESQMVSLLQPTLDSMIRQRTIGELIVVFPNARNALYGSFYLRSPVIGDYETYIAKDLVERIDAQYRTLAVRESRGLTGLSMGGWGSMHLALKFPDVFSVAVAQAGPYNSRSPNNDARARTLASYHPTNLTQFNSLLPVDWHLCSFQAMLAGLLPNPQRPYLYTDYPYEWVGGQPVFNETNDLRCRQGDVQNGDLPRYVAQPIRLNGIKIVHGSADADVPVSTARDFTNALSQVGVPFEYEEHSGAHEYRAILALPFLSSHLQGAVFLPTVRYVDANSASPTPPYTTWATAARIIQDAVDAAVPSDEIVVTNGIYATGGRAVGTNLLVNRVAVDKPLTLRSVNGPQFTVIQGYQVPGTTNGDGAIRCVYLANGASLSGFTLTNGATRTDGDYTDTTGGGVYCEAFASSAAVSNCVIVGNSADWSGGGAAYSTLYHCTLTGNSAGEGGGAYGSTLDYCTMTGNSAWSGGAASESALDNCILTGNSAAAIGGGAVWSALNNCALSSNRAQYGGGAHGPSTLNNCTLTGNSAEYDGGGVAGDLYFSCTLNNCTLAGNSASDRGGGAYESILNNCALAGNSAALGGGAAGGTLKNCTLSGNSAVLSGGGVSQGVVGRPATLANCIVYYNAATDGANFLNSSLEYCCTTPLPTNGVGNITNAPLFVDLAGGNLRLQSNSPCINAGRNAYAPGPVDLDGNPRIVSGTVDIGAYEFQGTGSMISYAWLQQFGLPTDGTADATDPDADGHSTWQEWRCATCPTNALSVLRLLSASSDGTNVTLTWQSVAGVNYFLECSTNLAATPRFTPLATHLPGQPGTTTYTDTNAVGPGPFFYRVGVGN